MDEQATPMDGDASATEPSIAQMMREAAGMDDEQPQDEQQTEADDAPDKDNADAAEAEADEQPQDELVEIEIDGKKIKVSKDGADYLLRQADYTRKTQALAEERKQAQAEAERSRVERQQYTQQLQRINTVALTELDQLQQVDWNQVLENDPQAFMRGQYRIQQLQNEAYQSHVQLQQIQQVEAQEREQSRLHTVKGEAEALLSAIPEWKDAAVAKNEAGQIKDYLSRNGVDQQTIDALDDHRAILLIRKAMQFDALQAKKPEVQKRVAEAPKPMKSGQGVKPTDGRTRAMQTVKTGSSGARTDAAASIFERMLGS